MCGQWAFHTSLSLCLSDARNMLWWWWWGRNEDRHRHPCVRNMLLCYWVMTLSSQGQAPSLPTFADRVVCGDSSLSPWLFFTPLPLAGLGWGELFVCFLFCFFFFGWGGIDAGAFWNLEEGKVQGTITCGIRCHKGLRAKGCRAVTVLFPEITRGCRWAPLRSVLWPSRPCWSLLLTMVWSPLPKICGVSFCCWDFLFCDKVGN